jgi:hypothetical protein
MWAAVASLRAWIERYGIPRALYMDWKNVFQRGPDLSDRGRRKLSRFGMRSSPSVLILSFEDRYASRFSSFDRPVLLEDITSTRIGRGE